MTRILRYMFWLGAISLLACGFFPAPLARAQDAAPFPYVAVGTTFEGKNFQLNYVFVTLDVYATNTEAKGTYCVENLANTTNTLFLTFFGLYRPVNVTAIKINQNFVQFDFVHICACDGQNAIVRINFTPLAANVLQIWWNFESYDFYEDFSHFPQHAQSIKYSTGYHLINEGKIPIAYEEVSFNFHTDGYYTTGRFISVWDEPVCYPGDEISMELPVNPRGVPYFLFQAEEIDYSTHFAIQKESSFSGPDVIAIALLICATGVAVVFPWGIVKKARKFAIHLSIQGFVSFILFVGFPAYRYNVWGVDALAFYLVGVLILLLRHLWRKRAITSAITTRQKALAHRRFYEETRPGAIDAYLERFDDESHNFNVLTHLAHAYFRVGKEDLAKTTCIKALSAPPIYPEGVKLLRSLCNLLDIDPASLAPQVLLGKGARLFSQGRFEEAREVFLAAYQATTPDSPLEAETGLWLNKCATRNGRLLQNRAELWACRCGGGFFIAASILAILTGIFQVSHNGSALLGILFLVGMLAFINIGAMALKTAGPSTFHVKV